MAVEKFTDAGVFFAGWNLTGQSNSVTLNRGAEILDGSVFGVGTRVNAPGLLDYSADIAGFLDSSVDGVTLNMFDELGQITNPLPLILYPKDADVGEAYTFMATQESLELLGTLGELLPFSGTFRFAREGPTQTYHEAIEGYLGAQHASRVAAGNGTAVQAGTLSSAQEIVFTTMTTAWDATAVDFILESDDAVGFDGTPSTRATHSHTAENEAEMTTVVGPITDDYWRVRWTVTGTSFSGIAVFGIAG